MTSLPKPALLRIAAALAATAAIGACAQAVVPASARASAAQIAPASTLPATPATTLPAPNTLPAPIAATPNDESTRNKNTPHRATVTYAAGLLYVRADNSSLNGILRQICKLTGMTVTGGVADERVFGTYGPADPSTILATLLDGTGSNMLLREGPNSTVAELTLTPRNGGATPPNPNSPGFDDGPEESTQQPQTGAARPGQPAPPTGFANEAQRPIPPQQQAQPVQQQTLQQSTQAVPSGPVSIPQPLNNVNGSPANTSPTASTLPTTNSVPIDAVPTPSTTPSTSGIVDAPNPPPAGSTTGTDATPESIFQQLQQMQQKSQQPSSTTPPQSTPPPAPPQ